MTATLQEIGTLVGIVSGVGVFVGFFLWLWIEHRARKVFPTRDELNGLGKRLDQNVAKVDELEDFTETNIGELREWKAGVEAVQRETKGGAT